jgi:hypothetical protein
MSQILALMSRRTCSCCGPPAAEQQIEVVDLEKKKKKKTKQIQFQRRRPNA